MFNGFLKVAFQGSTVTSDAGLILVRELDERLGLEAIIAAHLRDSRHGLNTQFRLPDLLRQSVYSRLAGYEDLNDAQRLSTDPTFRLIGSPTRWDRSAALTSTLHWFETELLTRDDNLVGLMAVNRDLIGRAETCDRSDRTVLDMDSSESPVHGQQEGSAYNGHFASVCYHPLFLFTDHGDCVAAKLRPGNVSSADDWDELLAPEIDRQQVRGTYSMTPHETGTPGTPRATAPPARTFGPQGPTLGELSDAYLQDYQVRQFRSQSTARGRIAHLTACFGRAARAAALTTYQIRQYQLARRAAGAATGTINRETSALHRMCTLAVHWGWLDTVPGFPDRLRENPPRQGFFEHPEYLAVRAHLPAPWQDILDLAYYSGWRKNEILGLTWDELDEAGGVIRLSPARSKTLVGRILPISQPIAEALARRRARRDPDSPLVFHRDGIPIRRWRTVAHRLSGGRGADPLPPRLPPHRRPQPDPRQRPRARRHAPDRPQDPRHLRPLQHHQRTGTPRGRRPARRLSGAARTGDAPWARAPGQPAPRAAPRRCCTNRHGPARSPPTGSSPADAV